MLIIQIPTDLASEKWFPIMTSLKGNQGCPNICYIEFHSMILTVSSPLCYKYDIIIFINCNCVVTRWQWLFNTNTKHEIGLLLNLRREGYMRSMLGTNSAFA
jgi:hypothetical protein